MALRLSGARQAPHPPSSSSSSSLHRHHLRHQQQREQQNLLLETTGQPRGDQSEGYFTGAFASHTQQNQHLEFLSSLPARLVAMRSSVPVSTGAGEFQKLMIKIPRGQEEEEQQEVRAFSSSLLGGTDCPTELGRGDEMDVASTLLSMSSMEPKVEVSSAKPESTRPPKDDVISPAKHQSVAPVINRMRKSCQCCTKSKLRCIGDGASPCERCTIQGTPCVYVHQRKRGPAPGSVRLLQKRNEQGSNLAVSTPSSIKHGNRDPDVGLAEPSPAEKKRKISGSGSNGKE